MSDIITKPLNVPPTPPDPYGDMFVTFIAQEANSTIRLSRLSTNQTLEYSTDNINWLTFNTSVTITLTNVGDKVYIRGVLSANNTASNYTQFTMTGRITASGNCNALWNYDDLNAPLKDFCGYRMFQDCSSLTTAPDLPATTLANNCYRAMFSNCSSLTTAPELPATILVSYCYNNMFTGCTSLTTAPELPATTLADSCYTSMFLGCTSLTTTPELPATTLTDSCYTSMFSNCSSLTTAPELPATILVSYCYSYMFSNCSSLTTTPELPATTLADSCYSAMFQSCTSLTTAPELPATTLADSCYTSMFQSCTSLTTAPELPATTLTDLCYSAMFQDCTSLNYIKCLATNISANSCTQDWVNGVASTGVFVKHPDISESTWGSGANGIPTGWTVIEETEPVTPEDIANEIMQEVDIFAVPFNDLYETCLSVYLDMGYNVGDFDEVYAIIQSTPNLHDDVETFVVSNDSNEKVITVDNNGDFYLKGVGGYDGKNTNTEDSNIKPLQDVINEKQEALVAGNNIDITNNVITSKGYTYNNGTITVNGNETITGKITATAATSHNLVYGRNELNLADLTNGNKLYLNYRNSTNPINEYIFCQGKGYSAEEQRSDITCRNINTSESIRSNFKLFNISSSNANKYSIDISTVGWYKIVEIDGAVGAGGTLHIGTSFYNTRPESYIVNFAEGWNDNSYYKYAVNAVIIGNQNSASNQVLIDKIGFIKNTSSPYTLSIYIHYNATVANAVFTALETGSANITSSGTRFYAPTYDSAITDESFTNIYSTKSGVNIKGLSNDFITGGNELNLSDVTSGNICYLNYRGSTNPINEYRFCKGVGNQSTYSDIRCGTLYQTSDITKKNIISDLDLDKAYDLIGKCQTIIYTLKDDERNKEQIGVIAQEIQEFFPEVVSADEDGYLALDYSRLTVVILKVLKDIIKRIQRLEEKE